MVALSCDHPVRSYGTQKCFIILKTYLYQLHMLQKVELQNGHERWMRREAVAAYFKVQMNHLLWRLIMVKLTTVKYFLFI
jgi:hypothetical protein